MMVKNMKFMQIKLLKLMSGIMYSSGSNISSFIFSSILLTLKQPLVMEDSEDILMQGLFIIINLDAIEMDIRTFLDTLMTLRYMIDKYGIMKYFVKLLCVR
jgi:hypothetical protein